MKTDPAPMVGVEDRRKGQGRPAEEKQDLLETSKPVTDRKRPERKKSRLEKSSEHLLGKTGLMREGDSDLGDIFIKNPPQNLLKPGKKDRLVYPGKSPGPVQEAKGPRQGIEHEDTPHLGIEKSGQQGFDGQILPAVQGEGPFHRIEKVGPPPLHLLVKYCLNGHIRLNSPGQNFGGNPRPLLRKPGQNDAERLLIKSRAPGKEREGNSIGPMAKPHLPGHGNMFRGIKVSGKKAAEIGYLACLQAVERLGGKRFEDHSPLVRIEKKAVKRKDSQLKVSRIRRESGKNTAGLLGKGHSVLCHRNFPLQGVFRGIEGFPGKGRVGSPPKTLGADTGQSRLAAGVNTNADNVSKKGKRLGLRKTAANGPKMGGAS